MGIPATEKVKEFPSLGVSGSTCLLQWAEVKRPQDFLGIAVIPAIYGSCTSCLQMPLLYFLMNIFIIFKSCPWFLSNIFSSLFYNFFFTSFHVNQFYLILRHITSLLTSKGRDGSQKCSRHLLTFSLKFLVFQHQLLLLAPACRLSLASSIFYIHPFSDWF